MSGAMPPGFVLDAAPRRPSEWDVGNALYAQESSSGADPSTSVDGAVGGWQITPPTWRTYARPGEDINNPAHNEAVGRRIVHDLYTRAAGDPDRVAVGYFSGPENIAPPGSPTPWKVDRHDGNGKYTSSYVTDMQKRLSGAPLVDGPAPAAPAAPAFDNARFVRSSPVASFQAPDPAAALPPGFTLDAEPASLTTQGSPAAAEPAPLPVSPDTGLPPGFTLDAEPVLGVDAASPMAGQELTNTPVSLADRFTTNVREAHRGTTLGADAAFLAGRLAPDSLPPGMEGPTPREQVRQADIEQQAQDAAQPPWYDQPTLAGKITHGVAALAGQLVGGMATPEGVIAGPESFGAVRGGAAVVSEVAKSVAVQAGVQGAANAGAQGLNIAGGTQEAFSPAEMAQSAALGGAIGAVHPLVAAGINKIAGPKLIQIKGADGVVRIVRDPGEPGAHLGRPFFDPANDPPFVRDAGHTAPAPGAMPPGFSLDQTQPPSPVPAAPPAEISAPSPVPVSRTPERMTVAPAPAPAARVSDAGTVSAASGRKLDVKYEVVPAASLRAAEGDLQPRDRGDRAAYDAQVVKIAAELDPARLMRAPEADRGAPIVGPDNIVESGNGRVAAINRAAELHPEKYAAYVQALRDAGHNVDGVDRPVLIARRTTDLSPEDRVAFTQEGSVSATAALSASEQARVDSRNLSADILAKYNPELDASAAGNRDFVRSWVDTLPESERNKVVDANGVLSADGQRRLNGAMLARAYGDHKGVLARGLESTHDDVKSVSGALADAAPAWARLRAHVEGGHVPPEFDVSGDLVRAADVVRQARGRRLSMNDVLTQTDMMNPLGDTAKMLVRALYNPEGTRPASRQSIADTLRRYAIEADKVQAGAGLFGDAARITPDDVLRTVMARRDADTGPAAQTTLLGGKGTGLEVKPPEPAPLEATLARLDARKAPDSEYRAALSTGSKDPLKPGETWRDRVVQTVESNKARDAELTAAGTGLKPGDAVVTHFGLDGKVVKEPHVPEGASFTDPRYLVEHDDGTTAHYKPSELAPDPEAGPRASRAAPPPAGAGPTRPPLGGVRPGREFNRETSPYRQVFRDAGYDPDKVVAGTPIARQVQIVVDHVKATFGFKDVVVDPKQHPKEVRDQLSNFYQNAREMANVLGMPYSAIGLAGRLTFTTKPYRGGKQALGLYTPSRREINIPGRANSFAHEWTHALDHFLLDALTNNPRARRMLSETASIADDRLRGRPVQPGSPAEAFVALMRALYGGDAPTAVEALKLQFALRSERDATKRIAIMQRLEQIEGQFAKGSRDQVAWKYYTQPAEMLARAHESYVSDMMQRQGGDTSAIAAPYYDGDPAKGGFAKVYPQGAEQAHIFQKFTDLHDALRAQSVLDPHGTGTGARPSGLDIVDPHVWDRMSDPKRDPGLVARLKRGVLGDKNRREGFWDRMGYSKKAADPGKLTAVTRGVDAAAALSFSIRGLAERLIDRQPPMAAREFQRVLDLLSPAEHVHSASAAAGRTFGPVFEEAVRARARPNINRLANILDHNDLTRMTDQEKMMLRHVLTEGDGTPYKEDGKVVPVPANVDKAAGAIRYLLDQEWEANKAVGIKIGYARSGYFPRMYDDHKIWGDPSGFTAAATKLHRLMFDREVGDDPAKLLALHDELPKDVRAGMSQDAQNGVAALRQNLKAQERLVRALEDGSSLDPVADKAKLAKLQDEARTLHDLHVDEIGDTVAASAAADWNSRVRVGDPTDYETRGPTGKYLQERKLPPEADEIMRDFMVSDPTEALPRYFQTSARKIAFAERFGPSGKGLDDMLHAAERGGARPEDIRRMRSLVEAVTGRQRSGISPDAERALNVIHAVGSMSLMPRAAWSSLSEPVWMYARTGNARATYEAFAHQIGDIVGTADSKTRAELANALGITTSHIYDSVIMDRTEGHYSDSPGLSKLTANFYRRIGLTQLTNAQRRSVMAAGHTAMDAWAKDLLGTNARLAHDAAAQFRDLGVADADHKKLAEWITARKGLPSLEDLDTAGGRLWGHAVSRLTDKIIQDPMKVDKPLLSRNPVGRLAYGLMSFNYAFFHNIVEDTFARHAGRIGHAYGEAKAGGAGKIGAAAAAVPSVLRAGAHIGTAAAVGIGVAGLAVTALRQAIFDGETWAKKDEEGDLGGWLMDLAFQRSGINGPIDPLIQAVTGLKYERDLSALLAGAQGGYFLQAAGDLLKAFVAGSPHTNTSDYNGIKGAWNLFGVPAAATALTAVPGGPLIAAPASAAMQWVTSKAGGDAIAHTLVGAKGSTDDGEPPPESDAPADAGGGGTVAGIPVGLVDDLAAPAARAAVPLWARLPKLGKIGAGLAAGAAGVSALADEFGRFE